MSTNDFSPASTTSAPSSASGAGAAYGPGPGTYSASYGPGDQYSGTHSTGFGGATYAPGSFSARTESWRSSLPHRSRNRLLAGVCGGIAEEMGVSPALVRLATLALAVLPGPMWLAYAIAWILMPAAD
ncbi:Phage shock protein PspC (stress-responsive transcriptional regulator) [Actinomyces denticolens]|uniref:Phage shock protein PspC (Stress-responsive transcriptional regulator) n=1 Tax=Actinomyces denticolens TaxID=52767 RepID=A0ABY1IEQ8_9ACTO|nr:PspC domain-containing protein [Actinomyces denticolens]SHJ06158.1 Phage shock protein PspC (stress-responsive transcriptional regulator) [Actinomyces denticolens]